MNKSTQGKKRKKEDERVTELSVVDNDTILALKNGTIVNDIELKDNFTQILDLVFHLDRECEKRRPITNCKDNPNCFHNLTGIKLLDKQNDSNDNGDGKDSISDDDNDVDADDQDKRKKKIAKNGNQKNTKSNNNNKNKNSKKNNNEKIEIDLDGDDDESMTTTTTTSTTNNGHNNNNNNGNRNGNDKNDKEDEEYVKNTIMKLHQKDLIRNLKRINENTPIGLRNLGATCYMNSVIQVLFMNTNFRNQLFTLVHNNQNYNNQSNHSSNQTSPRTDIKTNIDSKIENINQGDLNNNNNNNNNYNDKSKLETDKSKDNSNDSNGNQVIMLEDGNKDIPDTKKKNEMDMDIIYQLELLFYNLQNSMKRTVDPTPLVNCLQLPSDLQQDTQEFYNLFIELLDSKFKSDFITKLFKGSYNYVNECIDCKKKSYNPSSFFEITLKTDGLKSLDESLLEYISKEKLNGVFCTKCEKKSDCNRSIEFSNIPPNFTIQLLRYEFDKETFQKKKLIDPYSFPLELDLSPYLSSSNQPYSKPKSVNTPPLKDQNNNNLNGHNNNNSDQPKIESIQNQIDVSINGCKLNRLGKREIHLQDDKEKSGKIDIDESSSNIYELTAILMHKGVAVSSGHYLTHIKNEITGEWFEFDDEDVVKIPPERIGKDQIGEKRKPKEIKNDIVTSTSAYMIIYSRKDRKKYPVPKGDANSPFVIDFDLGEKEFQTKSAQFEDSIKNEKKLWKERKEMFKNIKFNLQCHDDEQHYNWISTEWFVNWIKGVENSAIDNSKLLCSHNKLDPHKLELMKRIPRGTWEFLHGQYKGSPILDENSYCTTCLFSMVNGSKQKFDEQSRKDVLVSNEKKIKNRSVGHYISESWYKEYIKKNFDEDLLLITTPTTDITCEHKKLSMYDKKIIGDELWEFISMQFPGGVEFTTEDKECETCLKVDKETNDQNNHIKKERVKLKTLTLLLKSPNYTFKFKNGDYFIISKEWIRRWKKYIYSDRDNVETSPPGDIDNSKLECPHGLFIYDFNVDQMSDVLDLDDDTVPFVILPKAHWSLLIEIYAYKGPLITLNNGKLSVESCLECHASHHSDLEKNKYQFKQQNVFIHQINDNDNEKDDRYYTYPSKTRRAYKRFEIGPVDHDYTVEQLKLLICSVKDVPTFQQKLYIGGGELLKDFNTLEYYKITPGQPIVFKETDDLSGFFEDVESVGGFKGTVLNQ